MKTLIALFLFLGIAQNSFAQTTIRLDRLCDHPKKLDNRGELVHYKCNGENYFLLKTDDPDVFTLLSETDKPHGRCRITTPPDCTNCKFFRVVCNNRLEHNYDMLRHDWSLVGDLNNPTGGKHDNHDGP